jgi:transposase
MDFQCTAIFHPHHIRHRYTNGMTEGFNNKIKRIQRRAFGLRNVHNRKKRILADCGRT